MEPTQTSVSMTSSSAVATTPSVSQPMIVPTPESVMPVASLEPAVPAPVTTAGGLNIDQMLQSLSTETVVAEPNPVATPTPIVQTLGTTFSIDALAKPNSPETPATTLGSETTLPKRSIFASRGLRVAGSVVMTFGLLVVGAWVFSKQYPIETQNFTSKLFGTFDSIATTTKNNMEPDKIVVENMIDGEQTNIHTVAPDNYITETPMADAVAAAQNNPETTTTEQVLDTVMDTSGAMISGGDTTTVTVAPASLNTMNMPNVNEPSVNDIKQNIMTLSQSAEQSLTAYMGNDTRKESIMRVVVKNMQALLSQIESGTPVSQLQEQYLQMKDLYEANK